ncbi:putative reverse transcriptase domain-containing protein [Tanacetum coccineum]
MSMNIQSSVKDKILAAQGEVSKVPLIGVVTTIIMDEARASRYLVHPKADKTYCVLRDMYWWPCMKKDIATYVSDCLTCSKVKAETSKTFGSKAWSAYVNHLKSGWDIYFEVLANVVESIGNTVRYEYDLSSLNGWTNYHSSIRRVPFEALYGKKCRLKAARDRQKSYADDNRRKPLEFEVDREVKSLKRSRIPIVKVRWNSKRGPEDFMNAKYPHLFVEQVIDGSTS